MNPWQKWILNALTLVVALGTAGLGWWQLGRAHQKEAHQASLDIAGTLPILSATDLQALKDPLSVLARRAQLTGQWLAEKTVYLENRTMGGRPGFYVLTPLRLPDSAGVILVQRGWIPRAAQDRTALAPIETPPGLCEVSGRIARSPSKLLELGAAPAGAIRHNVDIPGLETEWQLPLLSAVLIQEGARSEGLLRDWPQVASTAGKNYGYAFQWWALCALTIVLNVWFQISSFRRRRQPR